MTADFTYCEGRDCKERYFCKRYKGNYIVKDQKTMRKWLSDKTCINNKYINFIDIRK